MITNGTGNQTTLYDPPACWKNSSTNNVQCICSTRPTVMFSDDLFSGDYRDCTLVIWSTHDYTLLAASKTAQPVHALAWDPYTTNEFSSVGETGTLLFWMLDETQGRFSLSVHEAGVPEDVMGSKHMVSTEGLVVFVIEQGGAGCIIEDIREKN